ncbi:unnamed protein product [Effrenium voratum]|nr:unnamed protein product [Effrenium voratum]
MLQRNLNLCPLWNQQPACCTPSFEDEQRSVFELWKQHWKEKEQRLESFRKEMEDLRLTPTYQEASLFQRELFDTSLLRVKEVIDTYGWCFDTLLEYVAGMLCFPCQPHWHHQVVLAQTQVLRLRVDESSNDALWDSCRYLGAAGEELDHRLQDSMLAKQLTHAYVDFRMFYDRIRVSEYMEQIGRHIMRGPNELTIEERPQITPDTATSGSIAAPGERSLQAVNQNESAGNDSASVDLEIYGLLDPIKDGRRSGFVTRVFPRNVFGAGLRATTSLCLVFLSVVDTFEAVDLRGTGHLRLPDIKANFLKCQELVTQVQLAAQNPGKTEELSYHDFVAYCLGYRRSTVQLNWYDVSRGYAKWVPGKLVGQEGQGLEGIWHTGVLAFGREYWFGGKVLASEPGKAPFPPGPLRGSDDSPGILNGWLGGFEARGAYSAEIDDLTGEWRARLWPGDLCLYLPPGAKPKLAQVSHVDAFNCVCDISFFDWDSCEALRPGTDLACWDWRLRSRASVPLTSLRPHETGTPPSSRLPGPGLGALLRAGVRKIDPGIQSILRRKAVVYAHCSQGHTMQSSEGNWSVARLVFSAACGICKKGLGVERKLECTSCGFFLCSSCDRKGLFRGYYSLGSMAATTARQLLQEPGWIRYKARRYLAAAGQPGGPLSLDVWQGKLALRLYGDLGQDPPNKEELIHQFRRHADAGDGSCNLSLSEDQFCTLLRL